jgi:quinoprotein glucose dehydrogenase
MRFNKTIRKTTLLALASAVLIVSCVKLANKTSVTILREDPTKVVNNAKLIREKTPAKVGNGLELTLWASDSLAPDPVAMSIDDWGRVYLTRTVRQKSSEFDIRGHRDWMIESISFKNVDERRAFLRNTFATEKSKENEWLRDMNQDGIHDWHDLAVEKEEVWRLEDSNKDGYADVATRILKDFSEEVSDIAAGLLVRGKDAFIACAPDIWHLENPNTEGVWQKKTSISTGYGVHIGFSGHNLSGIIEGPDGRLYWNIGDIGASITSVDGRKFENPNSGLIARANPDGSDFEIFATGLRNTHEFDFDEYGNLISSDNDGDHPGESERLVHVVEGSDAGWRSNWQYGKYTDPKNNKYKVWMDEKLSVPHWDGQAAYIMPPIQNYHNGPTGMIYNPGTALGSEWKNKFFLVEFVGMASGSHIWSFGLKPKGASFVLDGEKDILSGVLPTGIKFGPDGALYLADWITGWARKDYGRVWKLDVTADKNDLAAQRLETKRLVQLDYAKQTPEQLYVLLSYVDRRVRQKAQFELVSRGKKGFEMLNKAMYQSDNQLARIHGVWGVGQLLRKDKGYATSLIPLLKDKDAEIVTQTIRMLGDAEITSVGNDLMPFLTSASARHKFFAAEALGQLKHVAAIEPLLNLLKINNDEDLYLRHAAVLALTRIGQVEPIVALKNSDSKALRTAAVLVLRRLANPQIALFLNDKDEYIVTEAARGINDDLSIPTALPALAAVLNEKRFTGEPLLRRAINAALRVGGDKELDNLIAFSRRTDINDNIKAEALATLGSWADPSVLDRVDGRFRGKITRDPSVVRAKVQPIVAPFLKETNPETLIAVAGLLANLNITESNDALATIFAETKDNKVKSAILPALSTLKYAKIESIIKSSMEDKEESIRTIALGLLSNETVTKESLAAIASNIFSKDRVKEQQKLLTVMSKLDKEKTESILHGLVHRLKDKSLSPNLTLELREAVDATGSATLKGEMDAIKPENPTLAAYADALYGGNWMEGRNIFNTNSTAQCVRCHTTGTSGATVGPNLGKIANTLSREQLLQALIDPSARIAPGYGSVSLKLKGGQEVIGTLVKEADGELTLKTSDAEPLVIPISRIEKRENLPSGMPPVGETLSKREIRDIVEYLVSLKR